MLNRHLSFRDVSGILAASVLLLGTLGCAQKEEMGTAMRGSAPGAGEIPFTTDSEAARALCEEGEYLSDVGRNVQAREKFIAAEKVVLPMMVNKEPVLSRSLRSTACSRG